MPNTRHDRINYQCQTTGYDLRDYQCRTTGHDLKKLYAKRETITSRTLIKVESIQTKFEISMLQVNLIDVITSFALLYTR